VEKTFFYLTLVLILIVVVSLYGILKPNLKEECLARGGTSVETQHGGFERCIEPS
jgi:hypothetical protein